MTTGQALSDAGMADVLAAEQWRAIPGWEGYYEASDGGRVRSLPRPGVRSFPVILKPAFSPKGYQIVTLQRLDRKTCVQVHSAVAEVWIGPMPDGMQVRHLDGDKTNNRASNLAYGTQSDNTLDQVRHGTHYEARKTHCDNGHEFTAENTNVRTQRRRGRTSTYRECRTCKRAWAHRSSAGAA